MTTLPKVPMTDLSNIARRFGYRADPGGFHVGLARICQVHGDDEMSVSTSDPATADALYHSDIGIVLYHQKAFGRLSISFAPQRLGQIVAAIEGYRS